MNLTALLEQYGESTALASGGLLIGVLFGFFAQRSRFCLRSAVIEFWHRQLGEKLAVWLLAFSSAVVGVQLLILVGALQAWLGDGNNVLNSIVEAAGLFTFNVRIAVPQGYESDDSFIARARAKLALALRPHRRASSLRPTPRTRTRSGRRRHRRLGDFLTRFTPARA